MGRREAEIDPDDHGPEAEFARALRRLRVAAGSPTYRELEAKVGYSDTALSSALSGRSRPSPDLVAALVPVLGGDPGEWHGRWVETFGPARTSPVPAATALDLLEPPEPVPAPAPLAPAHPRRRTVGVVALVVLLVLFAAVAASQWVFGWFSPSTDDGYSRLYAPDGSTIAMRSCPDLSCDDLIDWHNGTRVTMTCYRDAEPATLNYASNRWFDVNEPQSGRSGWVHSSQVGAQTKVGEC